LAPIEPHAISETSASTACNALRAFEKELLWRDLVLYWTIVRHDVRASKYNATMAIWAFPIIVRRKERHREPAGEFEAICIASESPKANAAMPAHIAAIRFISIPRRKVLTKGSVGGAPPKYATIGGSGPLERNQKTAAANEASAEIMLRTTGNTA
jgi:hypothetical protein